MLAVRSDPTNLTNPNQLTMPSDNETWPSQRPLPNDSTDTTIKFPRRTALGTITAGLATSLSGCLGFLGRGSDTPTPSEPETPTPNTPTDYVGRGQEAENATDTPYPPLDVPELGGGDALVYIGAEWASPEYRDFMFNVVPDLEPYYDQLYLRHLDAPQPINGWSQYIPCAAMEVQSRQGEDAFWTFHDEVLQNLGSYSESVVREAAEATGADPESVVQAGEERRRALQISEDKISFTQYDPPQDGGFGIVAGPINEETVFTNPTAQDIIDIYGLEE
jgi:hypothetical protein